MNDCLPDLIIKWEDYMKIIENLHKISKPEAPWSRDPVQFRENIIIKTITLAEECLNLLGEQTDEADES